MAPLFFLLHKAHWLRVSPDVEIAGMDISKHGGSAYHDHEREAGVRLYAPGEYRSRQNAQEEVANKKGTGASIQASLEGNEQV